jgi:hypothetical protein
MSAVTLVLVERLLDGRTFELFQGRTGRYLNAREASLFMHIIGSSDRIGCVHFFTVSLNSLNQYLAKQDFCVAK